MTIINIKNNRQTIVHKKQHIKLKSEQLKSHQKVGLMFWKGKQILPTCGTRRVTRVSTNEVRSLIARSWSVKEDGVVVTH